MPNSDLFTPKLSLAYAKIVATPSTIGWSQVYNAGSLFAALSLTITDQNNQETSLPAAGKNFFNHLEAEFFTLEKKTLANIKTAVEKSFENIPQGITADACLAFFKEEYLYLFITGKGKIIMKRGEKIGTLLEKKEDNPQLITASGILQQGDIILLQTEHFAQNISDKNIATALELQLPNDIAESLSPHIHEKEDGSQAAIIIAYNGTTKTTPTPDEDLKDSFSEQDEPFTSTIPSRPPVIPSEVEGSNRLPATPSTPPHSPVIPAHSPVIPAKAGIQLHQIIKTKILTPLLHLTLRQKISLCIGVIILLVLIISIMFTKQKQENTKQLALYQSIYEPAEKKYEEGVALKKLNQSLAQDDFQKAEKLIEDNIDKFKQGSQEQSNLQALLDKIQAETNNETSSSVEKTTPQPADVEDNSLLSIQKNTPALAYSQDENSVYIITAKAISTISKSTGTKKEIITNDNDWTKPAALTPYQGNIYVLDKKAGILKFVPSQSEYGKTQYFKGTPPDLSSASGMAIDGSIWILLNNGQILKYNRGEKEDFSLSGLNRPLANPAGIFTNIDTDYLYILDKGNARIVKVSKSGTYQNEVSANLLQQATGFELLEKNQLVNFLSNKKIYSLPLQ